MQDKRTFPDSASMDAPGTMKYDGSHKLRLVSIGAESTSRGRLRRGEGTELMPRDNGQVFGNN